MRISDAAIEMGAKQMDSEGSPTTKSMPVGRTHLNAVSYAALEAEVTRATCAPPARRNSLTTFRVVAFRVAEAPRLAACASFSPETSIAVTIAPMSLAICTAR